MLLEILVIIRLSLQVFSALTPAQQQAAWARHEERLTFWMHLFQKIFDKDSDKLSPEDKLAIEKAKTDLGLKPVPVPVLKPPVNS